MKYHRGWVIKNIEVEQYINGQIGRGEFTDNVLFALVFDDLQLAQCFIDTNLEYQGKLKAVRIAAFEVEDE